MIAKVEAPKRDENGSDAASDKDRRAGDGAGRNGPSDDASGKREPRRSLTERLLASFGESGEVLRRGQGLVAEVAQGTRDELARMVAAEVRGFLDRVDVVDLAQRIFDKMSLEIHAEVRFRRDGVEIQRSNVKFSSDNTSASSPAEPQAKAQNGTEAPQEEDEL
jgi:hypothetical protein